MRTDRTWALSRRAAVAAGSILAAVAAAAADIAILNPYEDVDWAAWGQHKANMHTHSLGHKIRPDGAFVFVNGEVRTADGTMIRSPEDGFTHRKPHPAFVEADGVLGGSDGRARPDENIDEYRARGYSILALTDHNRVTWPWTVYGRDPKALGMLAVQGCEPSRHHHMGSYFNDYDGASEDAGESLREIGARGGLAVLFHPGRYQEADEWYVSLYRSHGHLVGVEVYNQGDRYEGDRALWDRILNVLMPDRPVWGFSNDDAHRIDPHVGRNWQTFLLPELSEPALREAMIRGRFYFSYAPDGHQNGALTPAPVIRSIAVDRKGGTIALSAVGQTNVVWIAGGVALPGNSASLDVREVRGVVRAVLEGPSGRTYTQPFYVSSAAAGAARRKK